MADRLQGKTVAISGGTGGIGQALCRELAARGASIMLLDRNAEKAQALMNALHREFPSLTVSHLAIDLTDMESVQTAAKALCSALPFALILNAGAYAVPRFRCDTGWDNVFQINCAAPYFLARTVKPHGIRVVAVGSIAHNYGKTDPADVDFSRRRAASRVYGNAKRRLMFSLFALYGGAAGLAVTHPGITLTGITAHYPKWLFTLIKPFMKVLFMSPRKACLPILQGLYEDCGHNEWIGPRCFDIWGKPKKKQLHSCLPAEAAAIARDAEAMFEKMHAKTP